MINDWIFGQPTVILISGKAGSGKSTVADYFMERLKELKGVFAYRSLFAFSVKKAAETFFGWDRVKDTKGRKLLQDIGRIGREYDKDVWVKKMLLNVYNTSLGIPPNVIVIDDWRFPNEAEFLQKEGFRVWKVRVISRRVEENIDKNDISETSLDNYDGFDVEILNNGTKEQLRSLANLAFEIILKEAI